MLDFVEYMAEWSRDAYTRLRLSRPDLLDQRPSWGGGKLNAASLLDLRGDSLSDLSEVLRLAGMPGRARSAALEALKLYERKGNLVSAARARASADGLSAREVPV